MNSHNLKVVEVSAHPAGQGGCAVSCLPAPPDPPPHLTLHHRPSTASSLRHPCPVLLQERTTHPAFPGCCHPISPCLGHSHSVLSSHSSQKPSQNPSVCTLSQTSHCVGPRPLAMGTQASRHGGPSLPAVGDPDLMLWGNSPPQHPAQTPSSAPFPHSPPQLLLLDSPSSGLLTLSHCT